MKKKKIIFIIIIISLHLGFIFQVNSILLNTTSKSSNPPLSISSSVVNEWNRTWGGRYLEECLGVVVDSSDNIYLAGVTESFGAGGMDMALVKFDNSGEMLWSRTYGGSDDHELAHDVAIDSSGNIYLSGLKSPININERHITLVKLNNIGDELWNYTYYYTTHGRFGVAVDSSDNVYLAGITGVRNMILIKFNNSGVQLWNRTWGGSGEDACQGVAVDSSDSVYLVGYTTSIGAGGYDVVLVKYNSSGNLEWNSTWGGSDSDIGEGVAVDSLGNIYVTGYTESFNEGNQYDICLIKYNSSGILQWNRTWGTLEDEKGYGVTINSIDNIYVTGTNGDFVLVEYDSTGVLLGSHSFGGELYDEAYDVTVDSLDNVYIVGACQCPYGAGSRDMILVKYIHDTFKPIININSPSHNGKYGEAPAYDISIIEPNLESLWYTIDEWPNINIYINSTTQMSGVINQALWDTASYGEIIITFYAVDFNNNFGYSEVIIEKIETIIPGYSILTIISLIGVIVIIITKKNVKLKIKM